MPDLQSIPLAAWVFYTLLICLGGGVYVVLGRGIARQGGKVRTDGLQFPELLMSFVLAGLFIALMVVAIQRQSEGESTVKIETVLPSSLVFVVLCGGILAFLKFGRNMRLREVFGIDQMHPLVAIAAGAGLCIAALPLTHGIGLLSMALLKDRSAPQPLVELFSQVAREKDYWSVARIFLVGAVFAPLCEEFLFRGFCYGVWKRYIGPIGAALLASLLFAALHTSLTAFASLFVLAICLNIAYERSGSLLVPIMLHATFNGLSLLILFLQAQLQRTLVTP